MESVLVNVYMCMGLGEGRGGNMSVVMCMECMEVSVVMCMECMEVSVDVTV